MVVLFKQKNAFCLKKHRMEKKGKSSSAFTFALAGYNISLLLLALHSRPRISGHLLAVSMGRNRNLQLQITSLRFSRFRRRTKSNVDSLVLFSQSESM